MLLLQAAAATIPTIHTDKELWITLAACFGTVTTSIAAAVTAHYKGKHRTSNDDRRFANLTQVMNQSFTEVRADIAEVRAFVVGPDGENGLRSDVRQIRQKVEGLEERERDRLAQDRMHGYDRRT